MEQVNQTAVGAGIIQADEVATPDSAALAAMDTTAVAHRGGAAVGFGGMLATGLQLQPSFMKLAYATTKNLPLGICEGSFVIGKEMGKVVDPTVAIETILLGASPLYYKSYDTMSGDIKKYDSLAEAKLGGESLEWRDDPATGKRLGPTVSPAVDITMLVKAPAGLTNDHFCLLLDGSFYAVVLFTADKQVYKNLAPTLNRTIMGLAGRQGLTPKDLNKVRLDTQFFYFWSVKSTNPKTSKSSWHVCMASSRTGEAAKPVPETLHEELQAIASGLQSHEFEE